MTAKMTEEERRARREARAQARAAKIAEGPEIVEVAEKPTEEKKSLFERMTGNSKTASPKRRGKTKKVDPTILTQVAPLVLSTFAVAFIRQRVPEPYKDCAPAQDEVVNMVKPYFNILSRYVEVTGHLSENTIDLISAMLASIIYGTRAYVTYVNIKEERYGRQEPDSPKDRRDTPDSRSENAYVIDGVADDNTIDNINRHIDSQIVAGLFKQDSQGRKRLGLL